ncbi:enoyl-CoA hydratase/isomerase family protein [Lentibacillus saliphilus]|uniref:enoyl-CoA hydratase/isomerase family protein n=1 Tax=Lentibacillus saliphilus TaxID=2737028 RepID=UPI001C2F28DB|nr:enoyl-CoA hydratase/isomerase family protein [Lentibacillus saliphilus]
MEAPPIQYDVFNGLYGVIRLNRPKKHNAISADMTAMLKSILKRAKDDPIKCLVITGAGNKTFCAGGDLTQLHSDLESAEAYKLLSAMKDVLYEIVSFPVPTICVMNGNAVGGGCELATACDVRIARSKTQFGFVQANLGIAPGWGGGTILYEKVHPSFAYQWLMEGTVYDVDALHQKGWVHHIYDENVQGDFAHLLEDYLNRSIDQMRMLKQQYKRSLCLAELSTHMDEDVRACSDLWGSARHKQAIHAFKNKHKYNEK